MLLLVVASVLVLRYTAAQDADCDVYQYVAVGQRYYIYNPEYPNNYPAGRQCRWQARCPPNYNCVINCTLSMPSSPNCNDDRLLVSEIGDPQLTGARRYCGYGTFTVTSVSTNISIGLLIPNSSRGGRFLCNLVAQLAPRPSPSCTCGRRKQDRIVGGQETKVNEYPMMAGVIDVNIQSLLCGCVIITQKNVMTAAHCTYRKNPRRLQVVEGRHYIENENSGKVYNISQIVIHNRYRPDSYDYDISIITVQGMMQDSPVCLPFNYINVDITGRNITILGWGTTQFGGPTAEALQMADVQVISQQTCSRYESNITDRQLCAMTPGKDACQMDSGGPALLTDNRTGLLYSVGIISNGNGCASGPGVYTRVTALLQWVVANTSPGSVLCRP